MKTWSSEFAHHYETYSFGYCNFASLEPGERLADIYAAGYLPYSGKPHRKNVFYMARSARVDLRRFSLSSENRRILKKFGSTLECTRVPIAQFDYRNAKFLKFCTDYFAKRHGPAVMPKERLLWILGTGLITNLAIYRKNASVVAYVLEVSDKGMTHFWYSFYDLAYVQQSLGMWLMLDALLCAKERRKRHFYVGTVYGEKALYKANFRALEWWSGSEWIRNTAQLKMLARSDMSRVMPKSETVTHQTKPS